MCPRHQSKARTQLSGLARVSDHCRIDPFYGQGDEAELWTRKLDGNSIPPRPQVDQLCDIHRVASVSGEKMVGILQDVKARPLSQPRSQSVSVFNVECLIRGTVDEKHRYVQRSDPRLETEVS